MKFHGISGLYIIRKIFTDDCRKPDVDRISEENPCEGFGDDCLYTKCFEDARCLLSGRTTAEVLAAYYEISWFYFLCKIRI